MTIAKPQWGSGLPLVVDMAWIQCPFHISTGVVDQIFLSGTINATLAIDQNAIHTAASMVSSQLVYRNLGNKYKIVYPDASSASI
jgi:hypothetical protein